MVFQLFTWRGYHQPDSFDEESTVTLNRVAVRKASLMAWSCSGSTNSELVENLYNSGLIKNDRVKKAMLGVSVPFIS